MNCGLVPGCQLGEINIAERFVCGCVWFQYRLELHHMHRKLDLATSKGIREIY